MFVLYVLLIYIISIGSSIYIKEDSKLYSLRTVLGFVTFLAISQIFYYPLQYFNVSSALVNIITFFLIIPFFVLGIINLKKKDFKFLKTYEFWLFLILIFVVGKIIPGQEAGDDYFYMSLFKDNAVTNSINSIDPRTGLVGKIDSIYLYQGYYLFLSFLYRIQSIIFSNNISNIFISYRSTISLLSVIFTSQVFVYIKEIYIKKTNKVFYLIQLLSIFLVASLECIHIYWGSFMIFQIFIPLIIIIFGLYLNDRRYKYTLFIINLGTLSLASSMLFLFAIISFSYFVYELLKKNVHLEDYFLILFPSFIYISFVFNCLYLILLTSILFIIIFKFKNAINLLANKYLKYILLVLPILFAILSITGNYVFKLETYRISKNTLVYNILITMYVIYRIIKDKKIDPQLFLFMIVTIYFFNPIVQPFVSHHFTSTYVYYRLFYITKNPLIVTIIFSSIYEFLSTIRLKKIAVFSYIVVVTLLIMLYGYNFLKGTVLQKNYFIKYDYILREDAYSKSLGKKMKELESGSKIFSIYFAPRIYNEELITTVARYPDDYNKWYKDIIVRTIYREKMNNREYAWFNAKIKEENYDYLITYNNKKQLENLRDYQYKIMYENKLFVLIKVVKENL